VLADEIIEKRRSTGSDLSAHGPGNHALLQEPLVLRASAQEITGRMAGRDQWNICFTVSGLNVGLTKVRPA
jgi:hypothetical protein